MSVPAKLADEFEAHGWTVERKKDGEVRKLRARRGEATFVFAFTRNERGQDVLTSSRPEGATVASARREMSKLDPALVATMPDAEALAAVAGRTITWRNSMSGNVESGAVPPGGLHLKLLPSVKPGDLAKRVLYFADKTGHGFRSVYLGAIEEIA